jgi:hypothetical protein
MNDNRKKIGYWLLVGLGLVFAGSSVFLIVQGRVDGDWERVSAEILDVSRRFDEHCDSDGFDCRTDVSYAPTVRYVVDGQIIVHASREYSSVQYVAGKTTEVAYNPDKPDEARLVESADRLKIMGYIFAGLAAIILFFGVKGLVRGNPRKKKKGKKKIDKSPDPVSEWPG